eukprot:1159190-Pelagomonas_calceolata.AAC.7
MHAHTHDPSIYAHTNAALVTANHIRSLPQSTYLRSHQGTSSTEMLLWSPPGELQTRHGPVEGRAADMWQIEQQSGLSMPRSNMETHAKELFCLSRAA